MSRISVVFFATATLYALAGMVMGTVMGASGDHSMAPLHAHINLLGWASLGVMGAFYGIAGPAVPPRLAWVNYGLSNLGNALMLPNLGMILQGREPVIPVMAAGELMIIGGMLVFGASVLMSARRTRVA